MIRKTTVKITYEDTDITADVSPYLLDLSFTERAKHGETDDLRLSFENTQHLWSDGWFPDRGAKVEISMTQENWYKPGDSYELECGIFEIDDITDSGPESVFSIGALSVGVTSSIRRESKNKAWENIKLSIIADEIAKRHGFELFFDSEYDPIFDRFDQIDKSDMEFLLEISEYAGLNLKVAKNKIIIFSSAFYDAQNVSLTLKYKEDGYINHSFRATSADIYSAVHIQYLDPIAKKLLTYQYSPEGRSGTIDNEQASTGGSIDSEKAEPKIDPVTKMLIAESSAKKSSGGSTQKKDAIKEPKVGKVLKVKRRCKSLKEAEELAKSLLRNKNSRELTGTITLAGNLALRAGLNIAIDGFGIWDTSTWMIEQVSHSYSKSSGLVTMIDLRGVLSY